MNQRPTKVIRVDGEDLFYRAFLFKIFGWTVYLHKYLRSDPDRGLHSHPFDAYALILSGGYEEERLVSLSEDGMVIKRRKMRPGMINRIDRYCFHRVIIPPKEIKHIHNDMTEHTAYVQPISWSLFVCKYVEGKTWGFLRHYPTLMKDEETYSFIFRKHSETKPDRWWWKSAPKGKFVCNV